jgi:hypothetical protein
MPGKHAHSPLGDAQAKVRSRQNVVHPRQSFRHSDGFKGVAAVLEESDARDLSVTKQPEPRCARLNLDPVPPSVVCRHRRDDLVASLDELVRLIAHGLPNTAEVFLKANDVLASVYPSFSASRTREIEGETGRRVFYRSRNVSTIERVNDSLSDLDHPLRHLARAWRSALGSRNELFAQLLGRVDHVSQAGVDLGPGPGLEAAVRVDPELFRSQHPRRLLEQLHHLLDARDAR